MTAVRNMSTTSGDVEECAELEYDMWDGQFDFVGPQQHDRPQRQDSVGSDDEDLFTGSPLTPHLIPGTNGAKKTVAHRWCEDLTGQVQLLQQQVTSLADTQNSSDDRYARAKSENAVLQARVHMLEEQLREIEIRCEERMADEQKRCRETITRIERDRDSQIDTLNQRLNSAENEAGNMKQEVGRLKGIAEGLRVGADAESRRLKDAQESISELTLQLQQTKEAERRQREQNLSTSSLVTELQSEIERLKREQTSAALPTTQPELLRLEELHEELNSLRQENKNWQETVEELQAQILTRGIEEGRSLLNGVGNLSNGHENSLAAELEEMTNDQFDGCLTHTEAESPLEQMQKALKEQQDVNNQLRTYIDGILLTIVENYPQLLEVKHKQATV